MSIEVELGQHKGFRNGYPSLCSWISQDKDSESFIFRKFDYLGARNLLYMQAELGCLEPQLRDLDAEVWKQDDKELQQSTRVWEISVENAAPEREEESKRMRLVLEIRGKLDAYRTQIAVHPSARAKTTR